MKRALGLLLLAAGAASYAAAQTEPGYLEAALKEEVLSPQVAEHQMRQHILSRVQTLAAPASGAEWTAESKKLRAKILEEVVYHGWPPEWVNSPPRFTEAGVETGDGYRMRKLRYEIVPGFQSAAILYEPLSVSGKMPAILNVNGHVGPPGKSVEYKQKRCITFARNGILALNLEWLSFGELDKPGNEHWYGAHLDLVGANELGLFYLAMRRGLDYLYEHPNTDRARIGMTGLSGGGWQTIILSSLDERIRASAPVAGFSSIVPRVEASRYGDIGDVEQSATDLFVGRDYSWLAAMMAPRPTLLAYNAEDDCCFRAEMVKAGVFDAIRPFFRLYGKEDELRWHENRDPGTHNYQLDNRRAAYAFFSHAFGLPEMKEDPGIGAEVRSYEQLMVGLPADNLTMLALARQLADAVKRDPPPDKAAERAKLRSVVRYEPAKLERMWTTGVTKHGGVETKAHLFAMADGLSSTGIRLRAIGVGDTAPATIVLDDRGRKAAAEAVTNRVNRGEQVLAVDLPFQGAAWARSGTWLFGQFLYTLGERPLGVEASHLVALARLMKERGAPKVRVETSGMRNQVVALVAAAVEPEVFAEVVARNGITSLRALVDKPAKYEEASDLFCLDLYKVTDIDRLMALTRP